MTTFGVEAERSRFVLLLVAISARVEHEARVVLSHAKLSARDPRAHGRIERAVSIAKLDDSAVPRREAALLWIERVEEALPSRDEIGLAHDARALPRARVGLEHRAQRSRAEISLVLRDRRRALRRSRRSPAARSRELSRDEGLVGSSSRSPHRDASHRVERPVLTAHEDAPIAHGEVHASARCDREIALVRVVRPFDHGQAIDHFGDQEIEIRVALTVRVGHVVDGRSCDGELDVLPVLRVEAAQKQLVRLALARVRREKEPRREREQIRGAPARNRAQLSGGDVVLCRRRSLRATAHRRALLALSPRRGGRAQERRTNRAFQSSQTAACHGLNT